MGVRAFWSSIFESKGVPDFREIAANLKPLIAMIGELLLNSPADDDTALSARTHGICATMRVSSSTLSAAPSMFDGRKRAHSRWSPQKMYSGR